MGALIDILAFACSIGFLFRMRKYFSSVRKRHKGEPKKVSVIIPARNEARNLPALLGSMPADVLEVIVVDDNSTDETKAIAHRYGAKVFDAGKRPNDWTGKNWACHVGASNASGDYLLFTDADTIHHPLSLKFALGFLIKNDADMLSAMPYHLNNRWWEKLLGPFYCLIHCGGSMYDKQSVERAYAIGQYILIKSSVYGECGGHASVKAEVAEDVALAKQVLRSQMQYAVYRGSPLYSVQMYSTFKEFCRGWVRLIRLGMNSLSPEIVLNSMMPLIALNMSRIFSPSIFSLLPLLITLVCFALVQHRLGRFSLLGVLLFPIAIAIFLILSFRAISEALFAKPIVWKGRAYSEA